MIAQVELFIDGVWTKGDGRTADVQNPATGKTIARIPFAGTEQLEAAVVAAQKGFIRWNAMPAVERSELLHKAADLLHQRRQAIASDLTMEQGKPIAEAMTEIDTSVNLLRWFADEGRRINGQILPPRVAGGEQKILRVPIGPVAAFTPWNFPLSQAVRKLGPALATGCSVVIKPPENTPLSVSGLIRCFADAGLPAGVLNMVMGVPAEISGYLIPHPAIRKISFTGSVPVGKQLAAMAGANMKPATMELGGHAATILLADADLAKAIPLLVGHKFRNAGQVCVSPTRFLVERPIYDTVVEEFARLASGLKVGDGSQPESQMGPLISVARRDTVDVLVQDAVSQGAKLVTGGARIGNEGNFYEPTVLADVTSQMRIMNEEPFGPVALFRPFDDMDEMLHEANRLPFGLAAYAFGRDASRLDRIAAEIESGMLTVNHLGLAVPESHFGGIKDSGYGSEGGAAALEGYLVAKFITRVSA